MRKNLKKPSQENVLSVGGDKKAIAILTSDWHLSEKCPGARSDENWIDTEMQAIKQIESYQIKLSSDYKHPIPILVAGDIFDIPEPSYNLFNRLRLLNLQNVNMIPGQHDIFNHRVENLLPTAFLTLCFMPEYNMYVDGANFQSDCKVPYFENEDLIAFFCAWGEEIPDQIKESEKIKVLVCHKYVWFDENTCYNVEKQKTGKLSDLKEKLQQFDIAVFGDNHIPFQKRIGKCLVFNCGTLIRRKQDEREYKDVGFGILYSDGTIERIKSWVEDKFWDKKQEIKEDKKDSEKLFQELNNLQLSDIDYKELCLEQCEDNEVKQIFMDIFQGEEK